MGIFDRIGDVLKSYLNNEDQHTWGGSGGQWRQRSSDPDVEAAFEELDDFLSQKTPSGGGDWSGKTWRRESQGAAENGGTGRTAKMPERIVRDFAELGLEPGASEEECKAAYKLLLKKHHPDRHAGHPGNMKKATEKTTRINGAYDRIGRWRQTGKAD